MSHDHEHDQRRRAGGERADHDGPAPGKRALTDRLPVQAKARDTVRFDQSGEYREDRATISGPARDPLDFLDDERRRHGRRGHRRGGHHPGGGGGGGGEHEAAAAPVKLRSEITSKTPVDGGTELVALADPTHPVTPDSTFVLLGPSGRPRGHGGLTLSEVRGTHVVLRSSLEPDAILDGSRVLITIPASRPPELHPDGSIGDDDLSRLEA